MSPAGNTNITIGLAWGLTLLSTQAPFTEGEPYGTENLTKIMVLMTDGDNTENRWTSSRQAHRRAHQARLPVGEGCRHQALHDPA